MKQCFSKIKIFLNRYADVFIPILLVVSILLGAGLYDAITQNVEWKKQIETLSEEVEELESRNTNVKKQLSQKESEIKDLTEKNEDLSYSDFFTKCVIGLVYENDSTYYHTPICSLTDELGAFNVFSSWVCDSVGLMPCPSCHDAHTIETISRLTEEPKSDLKHNAETVPPSSQEQRVEVTVYITETGEKYHRAGCQYLRKSQIPISLDDAQAMGYTACSRCW